jgi:dTDP-4-dehydrorhamnose reductase
MVTGASGFLGYHLVSSLEKCGCEVMAVFRKSPITFEKATCTHCDLGDATQTRELLAKWQPSHIVHTAAVTSTATCEAQPEAALRDNFASTQNIIQAANEVFREKPFFVLISTDLVFDGKKGGYTENDQPNPIMVYGRTKRAAEQAVELSYEADWAIVRSALIYGSPTPLGRGGFLKWLLEDLRRGKCKLFTDEYRSPIAVNELCWLIVYLIKTHQTGLWHAGGAEKLSRYEIGVKVAEAFGLPASNIEPALLVEEQQNLPAPRPQDVSLDITKARTLLGFAPRALSENLADLAQSYPTS